MSNGPNGKRAATVTVIAVAALMVFRAPITVPAQAPTRAAAETLAARSPHELLRSADDSLFPESFVAVMRMVTTGPSRRDSEMVIENSHRPDEGSFMEVLEPSRSRGMRFLQKGDDLWMYNPRSGSRRAIRLSPRDSFQGSVFSNNDVSDPNYEDDYTPRLRGVEQLDHPVLGSLYAAVLDADAAHDNAAYGRITMWLILLDGAAVPVRIDYVSRSGLPFKRMLLHDLAPLAGRTRPRTMYMESLEEVGSSTTVTIESLEARTDLPARMFNLQELTR
jgi:hypothetical protein